jgi:hypothetical protein
VALEVAGSIPAARPILHWQVAALRQTMVRDVPAGFGSLAEPLTGLLARCRLIRQLIARVDINLVF